jgi:hypothetical protein
MTESDSTRREAEVNDENIPALPTPPAAAEAAAPPDPARVASAQKLLIIALAIVLAVVVAEYALGRPPALRTASLVVDIVALVLSLVGVVRMGLALPLPWWATALCFVAMFVGLLNIIVMGWMNARAMKVLRAAGWKVGFFGSKPGGA